MNRSNVMKRLLCARRRLNLVGTAITVPKLSEVRKYFAHAIVVKTGKSDRTCEHEMEPSDEH